MKAIPVIYMTCDLFYLDGSSAMKQSLTRRKDQLDWLSFNEPMFILPLLHLDGVERIEKMFTESRRIRRGDWY